jgi:hypothetical protein
LLSLDAAAEETALSLDTVGRGLTARAVHNTGTSIALLGTYLYTEATKKYKPAPKPSTPPTATA